MTIRSTVIRNSLKSVGATASILGCLALLPAAADAMPIAGVHAAAEAPAPTTVQYYGHGYYHHGFHRGYYGHRYGYGYGRGYGYRRGYGYGGTGAAIGAGLAGAAIGAGVGAAIAGSR